MKIKHLATFVLLFLLLIQCKPKPHYEILIRNGLIVDGTGVPAYKGDVAISGDTIAALGELENTTADQEIDATGQVVAPGFINMLSWANEDLIADGNSQSDIRQGVTLEVFGEGWSMGPLGPEIKEQMAKQQGDIKYEIEWTTLNEYLEFLERKGVSTNVASFLGATTLRINTVGYEDREAVLKTIDRYYAAWKEGENIGGARREDITAYSRRAQSQHPMSVSSQRTARQEGGGWPGSG